MRHAESIGQIKEPRSRPTTFERGRVCGVRGCGTRLSIYNPSRFCAVHEHCLMLLEPTSRLRRQPVIERHCANDDCGAAFLTQNQSRLYCSDHCRRAAYALRHHLRQRAA